MSTSARRTLICARLLISYECLLECYGVTGFFPRAPLPRQRPRGVVPFGKNSATPAPTKLIIVDISLGIRYINIRSMKENLSESLPLSPATLHILLALAGEDLHGYGIMQEVLRQSEGQYKLGPGTLYDNLQKMMRRRLVEGAGRGGADDDPRRRYYRLTSFGRAVLAAEVRRLDGVVREAKLRLQPVRPRRA